MIDRALIGGTKAQRELQLLNVFQATVSYKILRLCISGNLCSQAFLS